MHSLGSAQVMWSSPGVACAPQNPRIPQREQRLLRQRGRGHIEGKSQGSPRTPKGHSLGCPLSGPFFLWGKDGGRAVLDKKRGPESEGKGPSGNVCCLYIY